MNKLTQNNLKIISKQYAYLQTMTYRKLSITVRGVAYTKYILIEGVEGWTEGQTKGGIEGQNAKYYVSLLFFEKGRDKK